MRMAWLPWRARRFLAWANANRHDFLPDALARRKPYSLRVLVSTAYFGGVGGTEKHLKSLIESMPDCFFDVRAREIRVSGFRPVTTNFSVNRPPAGLCAYDLYLYFAGGGKPPLLRDAYPFKKTVLETNGASVRDIQDQFDYIAIQTGNHANYTTQPEKCIPAFPDVPATFPRKRKAVDLPARYFLTVFNPFSNALKGNEVLYRAADAAAMPIVWCFSDKSGFDFEDFPDHPKIIKKKNLSQPELYYAYEHASAYLSVSHMESFGWSLAEAFYLGLPIIAREVGFLTYVKQQPGIHLFTAEEELQALLLEMDYSPSRYNYEFFARHSYPEVIRSLLS